MDEQKFLSLLQSEERAAVGYRSSEISDEQEDALDYYLGEPFGNEEEGRSKVVSRDVATTIDSVMPDLMKVFLSSDKVVEFEPEKPGDEEFADQATDYCNYIFYKDNKGRRIVHDLAKDGLLSKIGVIKTYWDDTKTRSRETYTGIAQEAIIALAQEANVIEHTPNEDGTADVTVIREAPRGRVVHEGIPSEEFLIKARTREIESSDYTAHKTRKTIGELLAMGFDKDKVMNLASDNSGDVIDEREQQRHEDENYLLAGDDDSPDPMMRQVWVLEEYVRCDYDEDDIVEMRQIIRVNKVILSNEEVDEHPFSDFVPCRMPHKVVGKSLADDTMDIQLVKSTLLRQSLDNLYISNNPRTEVPEAAVNDDTFDDLLTVRPNGIVRTRGEGGLKPLTVPFTAGSSFDMLGYWDGEREQRTGVTRYNQGLDADTLNQTATGIELIQNKGMGKIELIVLNLAETLGNIFEKTLRLIVKHQDQERVIQLRGEWVPMMPNAWNADMKASPRVGLGSGDKGERVKGRGFLLQQQFMGLQAGLVTPEQVYNNMNKLIEDMELGDGDKYWPSPQQMQQAMQGQPEKPNPEMLKLQADQQAKQAELQLKQQESQAKLELKAQEDAQKLEHDKQKFAFEMQAKREQVQIDQQLARDKAAGEFRLAQEKMDNEIVLANKKIELEAQLAMGKASLEADVKLSTNRPGGSLNE